MEVLRWLLFFAIAMFLIVAGIFLFRRERVRALLGLLLPRRSVRRSDAATTLWPDHDDELAVLQEAPSSGPCRG